MTDPCMYRRPIEFLSELAQNASERDIKVAFLSGNLDSLITHYTTEGEYKILLIMLLN